MATLEWNPPSDPNGVCDNRSLTEAVQALHAFVLASTGQAAPIAPQTVHATTSIDGQPVDVAVTVGETPTTHG